MKTIIAEKPSVAREIARIVGATDRQDGYITGNGYAATWAFGHLIALAMPENYGKRGYSRETLPILPTAFNLIPRQAKTDKGYQTDPGVLAQLKVISKLFQESENLIVATDAGREGELIFRYIYNYLKCSKPFQRLWISSLTDQAIRKGLDNLKNGTEYDNLYFAARARSEADWLIGINSTQAISIAAGRGTYSLGRVQTPTLGMVCSRYYENKNFTPQKFWQMHISMQSDETVIKASSIQKWEDKTTAEQIYDNLRSCPNAIVEEIERKETVQEAPFLYDLTSLQKAANSKHGFSAEETLTIAQKLYENKLITYPRTGCCYIPEDVFSNIPELLASLKSHSTFGKHISAFASLNKRSVNGSKITDHHALLITGIKPQKLSAIESIIFDMIAGRMLESFSAPCIKDVTTISFSCNNLVFTSKGSTIKQSGWRSIYKEEEKEDNPIIIPEWRKGDTIMVHAHNMTSGLTKPKPLHTEATLLAAMETAGKELEEEEQRQLLKDCGIGTPATRASIIETLLKREYIVRSKKTLIPTEKGQAIYSIVKNMKIANVQMTGEWEAALYKIEHGLLAADDFRHEIENHAIEITAELLSSKVLFAGKEKEDCLCPKCQQGRMHFYNKVVKCDNPDCGLPIFRNKGNKILTENQITDLITKGQTSLIKGFKSKAGKNFDAFLIFDENFNVNYKFPEIKKKK